METKIKQLLKTIKLNESLLSMLFGVVTVILVGVLIFRMYKANKPQIDLQAEKTQQTMTEKIGDVSVEIAEDGKKYPTDLPETYKVEKGDHLWAIATKLYGSGYNWVDIAKENKLTTANQIAVGQELKLPKVAVKTIEKQVIVAENSATPAEKIEGESYKVVKGDNLWSIAVRAYGDGYKWVELAKANELKNPGYIEVGQAIKLPR